MKLLPITIEKGIYSLNIPPMTVAHALLVGKERAFLILRLLAVGEATIEEAVNDARTKFPEFIWKLTNHPYQPTPKFRLPPGEPKTRYIEFAKVNGQWRVVMTEDNEEFLRSQSELGSVAANPGVVPSSGEVREAMKSAAGGR
jgi:hypothetical protein